MIDPTTLNFGESVYRVDTVTNWVRDKIKMTDADGNGWYRYKQPSKVYNIQQCVYCGKRLVIEYGECEPDSSTPAKAEYHFKDEKGAIEYWYVLEFTDAYVNDFFYTKNQAEQYIEELKRSDND